MAFTGEEGGEITLQEGITMNTRFHEANLNPSKAVFVGKHILHKLLHQDGAMGIRCYFAINDSQELTLVMVAADANEKDMTSLVANKGMGCPSTCDTESQLCIS